MDIQRQCLRALYAFHVERQKSSFVKNGVVIGFPGLRWFGVLQHPARLGFWNAASNQLGFNIFGFRDVLIETSINGLAYTPLTGSGFTLGVHTFAQAADSFGNLPEIVNFTTPVVASFVRFTVQSNYNEDDFAGYNTVMFDGTAVPEVNSSAANLPFCFVSGLLLAGVSRRKKLLPG